MQDMKQTGTILVREVRNQMQSSFFFMLILSVVFNLQLAKAGTKTNYALIKPTDTRADIIRKAANVAPSPQQYAWQKMEFTAFVHFGMNTFTSKDLGSGQEDPKLFNPTNLDCDQWARVFKEAGMKMAILTAKHHDGFCLWPSKYTDHSVKYSLWKNGKGDVVREFVSACRKYGLKVGLYLSPWDRNNPSYGTSDYNRYFMDQLKELLTNYGKIDELWFDGYKGPEAKSEEYDWHAYYKLIRRLQPEAVIAVSGPDVRWVGTESGYGRDTEWDVIPIDLSTLNEDEIRGENHPIDEVFLPHNYMGDDLGGRDKLYLAKGLFWYPAETDVSIRPDWFYKAYQDSMVKSVAELVDIYFNSLGKNSVLLLNVPPDKRGLITKYDIRSLMGLHRVIKETFSNDFVMKAVVHVDGQPKALKATSLFGKGRNWISKSRADTASLEFVLPRKETFDVAALRENILVGQRIEEFRIDYWDDGEWRRLSDGTTVGYERLLRFNPVTTDRVRVVIQKSRLNPTLAHFGLYMLPAEYLK